MATSEYTGHVSAMRADSEFYGAEDFAGRGDVPAQIIKCNRCVNRKACGVSQKEMFTLSLMIDGKSSAKEFWLKPTNRKQIIRLYGPNVGDWKSQWIWLYVEEVRSPQGGVTLGIRIRDKKDAPKNTEPAGTKSEPPKQEPKSDATPANPIAARHAAICKSWKERRLKRDLRVAMDDVRAFFVAATEGCMTADNALKTDLFGPEVLDKVEEFLNFEMPE